MAKRLTHGSAMALAVIILLIAHGPTWSFGQTPDKKPRGTLPEIQVVPPTKIESTGTENVPHAAPSPQNSTVESNPLTIPEPTPSTLPKRPDTSDNADSRNTFLDASRPGNNSSNRSTDSARGNPLLPSSNNGGRSANTLGKTSSASEGQFNQAEIADRPFSRPAEVLEQVPGLIATQHSGSGKANQYFVRGFNLDHGTDLALRVNEVPINLPSHAHGQGYLDINWLIPELIESADYQLGPYSTRYGDFSSAGGVDLQYRRTLPAGIASVTAGQFDYYRTFVADSISTKQGATLYAFETVFYNGPWDVPEDFQKFNGVIAWSRGNERDGHALTLMGYSGQWTATNQIANQAVEAGLVDRFGSLDPSDGGRSSRATLNYQSWSEDRTQKTTANVFLSYYDLNLFSNFTYFLDDPVNGDQIQQRDGRYYTGYNLQRIIRSDDVDHTLGTQFRSDNIYDLELNRTNQRALVSQVRSDNVDQQNVALYYRNDIRWTPWMRTTAGLRGDAFRFHNRSRITPADSGTVYDQILSPKAGLVLGPWADTELFLNWGHSFHSNDTRGINSSVDPANPLVKSKGREIGARSWLTPDWISSITYWHLELDSELVFVGDAGTTEPGPASERNGITWTNNWSLNRWAVLDLDASHVRPRFTTGERIPNAVENVVGAGLMLKSPNSPWYNAWRLRHYGPASLIEDNSARSSTTSLLNTEIGYQTKRWQAALDIFNVLNRKDNDITYFYESQPLGLAALEDYHYHPVEPIMARFTLTMWY